MYVWSYIIINKLFLIYILLVIIYYLSQNPVGMTNWPYWIQSKKEKQVFTLEHFKLGSYYKLIYEDLVFFFQVYFKYVMNTCS